MTCFEAYRAFADVYTSNVIGVDLELTPSCKLTLCSGSTKEEQKTMKALSIKQASQNTGLSEDTIRYYEKIQLLPPARRNNSGRRVYESDDLERMTFITHLKSAGMSLDSIKYFLHLSLEEDPNAAVERLTLLTDQKEKLESKLAELQAAHKVIEYKVKHYQDLVCVPKSYQQEKKEQEKQEVAALGN
jgi:DNA-binding transcriptional MerR regulator